jgi:hypothetical protein
LLDLAKCGFRLGKPGWIDRKISRDHDVLEDIPFRDRQPAPGVSGADFRLESTGEACDDQARGGEAAGWRGLVRELARFPLHGDAQNVL